MEITLNGEQRQVRSGLTVSELLEELRMADATLAIALNREFVPRSEHATHTIEPGDVVELVAPMQGG